MTTERDESTVTITGAAPGTIMALRRAAAIAAEHGHNWIGVEDLLAAILTAEPFSLLELHWPRQGRTPLNRSEINEFDLSAPQQPLTFAEVKRLVQSIVPGEPNGAHGPAARATVTYEVTGPHAEEFREEIERGA
ncbi:hypothetical protein [Nocardia gipuzkoensis]|uniref:hypothetical protein n=1 Tax=Nocardia gipuzkoensis TaxID=2749991 RepID=UPI00237DC047|nr:hypothetical protein [Nocardia gipuzkoensis]MDE1674685.1 hypothetical protein [Nocardia gipuzkoensis]